MKRGASDNRNEVNVSPMSDRGRSASQVATNSGFTYLQEPAQLPSTVTRRGGGAPAVVAVRPAAKRATTPRGKHTNPFAGKQQANAKPVAEEIDTDHKPPQMATSTAQPRRVTRRPIGVGAQQLLQDPFAGSLLAEDNPTHRTHAASVYTENVVTPSSPSGGGSNRSTPLTEGAAQRPPVRRSSSGRRRTPTKQSSPVAEGHVSLSTISAEISEQTSHQQSQPNDDQPRNNRPSENSATMGRGSAGGRAVFLELKGGFSVCMQMSAVAATCIILCFGAILFAAPLFVTFEERESELIRDYVQTTVQMQATYRAPAMGLNASDTRCLYLRVLQHGSEKLDDAIARLPKEGLTYEEEVLRLNQIARAYHMLRHRARLYARSRDSSVFNHVVVYPFRDAFVYGVLRHGWTDTLIALLWRPTPIDWFHRLMDVGVCMRQMEQLPCPSFDFVKEKALRKLTKQLQLRDGQECTSVECLRELTAMLVDSSGRSNQWYNDAHCAEEMKRKQTLG